MGKKITQLATITEVADDDLIVGVDVSDTSGSDNGTNKKFTKATLLAGLAPLDPQLTGWNPDAETWVYHNVDDPTGYFKIEGKDVSANYSVGWRIMFTNGGNVIKGIITAITYSDPDTIITFLHEIDPTDNQALYLLTNSAITENYFSPHKAPQGFPLSPVKWEVKTNLSGGNKQTPTSETWYNVANNLTTIPIGVWNIRFKANIAAVGSGGYLVVNSTLSNANNTEWDNDLTVATESSAGITQLGYITLGASKTLTMTSKTNLYLNLKTDSPNTSGIYIKSPSCIWATCAYL